MKKILFFLFVFINSFYAQSWHYFTTANSNIPSDYLLNVYVDNAGDVWTATGDTGIVKYSGTNFYCYNASDIDVIKDQHFSSVLEDENSYYWFTSEYGGIYYLHNGQWHHFAPKDMGFDLGPYESLILRTLAVQNGGPFSQSGGALWIGAYNNGLIKFDGHTWKHYGYTNVVSVHSVYSIAVEESQTDTNYVIWIGTSNGLIKYDGTNWSLVKIAGDSTAWVNAIALEDGGPTFNGGKMYVGTEYGQFCIYDGNQWEIFNLADAYNPNNSVNAIVIDASKRKWIATSDEGLGMYDGKQLLLYYKENSGIAGNQVISMAVREQGDSTELFMSCFDNTEHNYTGLTLMRVEKITGVETSNKKLNYSFRLSQNYPNPFNPSTTINYSVPATKKGAVNVKLVVYDVLGKEVATLVNETQTQGNYSVKFNAQNLSSGLYFYKLQAGNFVATKKMMLLK
jgi:ligand-binding sensor domain-containing protein